MLSIPIENLYQQVKSPRGHYQVGNLLEGSDLARGSLQADGLDNDADDGSGPQTQECGSTTTTTWRILSSRSLATRLRTVPSETPIWSAIVVNDIRPSYWRQAIMVRSISSIHPALPTPTL